jgi:hypothetical protein
MCQLILGHVDTQIKVQDRYFSQTVLFQACSVTVKPDVRFRGILQHCWEYCNFDCEIALSKLQLT